MGGATITFMSEGLGCALHDAGVTTLLGQGRTMVPMPPSRCEAGAGKAALGESASHFG